MHRTFSVLLILGLIVWAFLLLDRANPGEQAIDLAGKADDANTADRCAKYKSTDEDDSNTWSLGYEGRIRQLAHGCF
ncbi:hypothetical protein HY416_03500 [Candidatus Kaiserbacteria bacterium]|nr:hypothetical protein [Candidatus Kaiserbacteria bacterium]